MLRFSSSHHSAERVGSPLSG